MESKWEFLDENDKIKERFRGYKDGLVTFHGKEDWIVSPKTAEMMEKYQVRYSSCWYKM